MNILVQFKRVVCNKLNNLHYQIRRTFLQIYIFDIRPGYPKPLLQFQIDVYFHFSPELR